MDIPILLFIINNRHRSHQSFIHCTTSCISNGTRFLVLFYLDHVVQNLIDIIRLSVCLAPCHDFYNHSLLDAAGCCIWIWILLQKCQLQIGGDPGAVAKAACLGSQIYGSSPLWHSGFKETNVSSQLTRKDSIWWGVSVTDSSMLGLRSPVL